MTDHTTLIAELRKHAEWARRELRQSQAELFDRAADALEQSYDVGYRAGLSDSYEKSG